MITTIDTLVFICWLFPSNWLHEIRTKLGSICKPTYQYWWLRVYKTSRSCSSISRSYFLRIFAIKKQQRPIKKCESKWKKFATTFLCISFIGCENNAQGTFSMAVFIRFVQCDCQNRVKSQRKFACINWISIGRCRCRRRRQQVECTNKRWQL